MRLESFPPCPPRTVQHRFVTNSFGESRTLWRSQHCNYDRWHYWENPCNCFFQGRPNVYAHLHAGYALVNALPETGTWKRDGHGINSIMRRFRREIRAQREAGIVAHAAVGPRPIGRLTSLPLGQMQREWLDLEARRDPDLTFMGVPVYWDKEWP